MIGMRTLFDKIWDNHVVAREEDETLLYVDRCLIHEGSRHTFDTLHERGLSIAHPDKVFAFSDHYIPTDPRARAGGVAGIADPEIRNMVELLIRNTDAYGIARFGWGDDRQGILHVAGPELGLSLPGLVERAIALALEPPLGVPHRLPVPPQNQPDPVAQRVLPWLTTSSGSGIWGQSFQIRSSA